MMAALASCATLAARSWSVNILILIAHLGLLISPQQYKQLLVTVNPISCFSDAPRSLWESRYGPRKLGELCWTFGGILSWEDLPALRRILEANDSRRLCHSNRWLCSINVIVDFSLLCCQQSIRLIECKPC